MPAVWTWLRGRPTPVDLALAVVLWLAFGWLPTGAAFFGGWFGDPRVQGLLGLAALMAAPVALRRSHPSWALVGSCAAGLVQLAYLPTPQSIDICFLFALYGVATYDLRRGARYTALGVGWIAAGLCTLRWSAPYELADRGPTAFVLLGLSVSVTWVGGALVRTRRLATEQAVERARAAELDAERQLRLAAAQERAQIARELHDIVAHSVAVMVVQADGGRYVAARDPARAVAALATIAESGREALTQMRQLLGVLRDERREPCPGGLGSREGARDPAAAPTTPQPVLADLPALLDGVRGAGVAVHDRFPDPLPETTAQVAAVAYRIVQESLTNVLRHAGPRAAVEVGLWSAGDRLVVQVSDDGFGAAAAAPGERGPARDTGRGLVGMRERVALVSGRVSAGPAPGGGWRVHAELPVGTGP